MKNSLRELKRGAIERIEVDEVLNLESAAGTPLDVWVTGTFTREGDEILAKLRASADEMLPCSRCLTETAHHYRLTYEEVVDDIESLDLAEIMRQELTVAAPSQVLCKRDCKGLCPICGEDRNLVECDCQRTECDPRLSRLKQLFEE